MNLLFDGLSILSANLCFFVLAWLGLFYFGRISWVDVLWAASIGAWSLGHLFDVNRNFPTAGFLIATISLLWSLRLSSHLFFRLLKMKGEDRRYEEIKKNAPKAWSRTSLFIFLMNAILVSFLLVPQRLVLTSSEQAIVPLHWVGLVISLLSILGEALADHQLKGFILKHPGKTCAAGLWKYSRHPNYFFEWLFWVGIAVMALPSKYGYLALSAPLLMYLFLNYFTGVKISEAGIEKRRKDFAAYKKKTSAFFLWFPQ